MKLGIAAAVVSLGLATAMGWLFFLLNVPVPLQAPIELEVRPGQTPQSVAAALEQRGVVRSARALLLLARMRGADRRIRHGIHGFSGALTPKQVLEELVRRPAQPTQTVTIPEGLSWSEVAELLEQQGVVGSDEYRAAACDPELAKRAGASPDANCTEGYLFPDTYELVPGTDAEEIAALQVARFEEVFGQLLTETTPSTANAFITESSASRPGRRWATDPAAMRELVRQTVVLASIIEKETSVAAERELISSVFHNRLGRGMRLQADPTVIYGLHAAGKPWDGTRLHHHLKTPGPYNTYTGDGLPPGPICNPGREALRAALMPAASEYLYFVSTGDGAHRFSATLAEHNRAVARLRSR